MTKTSKFLLCENPRLDDSNDGRQFILHTRDPILFAEILNFDVGSEDEINAAIKETVAYGKLDYDNEVFLFLCRWIFPGKDFLSLTPQQQSDEIAGIMRRMADWYQSYLNWEDQQG